MKSSPQRSRIRRRISDEKRIRFSNEPPQRVGPPVRPRSSRTGRPTRVVAGEDLDPVEAARLRPAGGRDEARRSAPRSRPSVIAWLPSASWYEGRPDGDQFGANELSASPCWPTWYSWWIITMSGFASRQASVRRRKAGMIASSPWRKLPRVRTAGAMDRHGLHDDHPDAAERPLAVVADVALRRAGRSSDMLAVCAPKLIRLRSVRCRRVSGAKTCGKLPASVTARARLAPGRRPRRPCCGIATAAQGEHRDHATDRRDQQDHDVDEQAERERRVARDAEPVGDGHDGQLERADVAGTGRDDRDERHAAGDQGGLGDRQLDPDGLAGHQERGGRRGPGHRAEGERDDDRRGAVARRRGRRAADGPARGAAAGGR